MNENLTGPQLERKHKRQKKGERVKHLICELYQELPKALCVCVNVEEIDEKLESTGTCSSSVFSI